MVSSFDLTDVTQYREIYLASQGNMNPLRDDVLRREKTA
jgi:hypothetical protein